MIHPKQNPVGIDLVIDRIQKSIYDPLLEKWSSLDVYSRVYKNIDNDGMIVLERYTDKGGYEPVLFSEGNKIFFVQGDAPDIKEGEVENNLWAVCILKLSESSERNDEHYHIDLVHELTKELGEESVIGIEYGMKNLKKVVEDPLEFGNFKFGDIHPYHFFMVKTKVEYDLTIYEC